jgi:calcineurin-like phosphoesterase family protein
MDKRCNVFVISDTHFLHDNIIKYCNRPFNSVEGQDKVLVRRWNNIVLSKDDIVIHLGDFALHKDSKAVEEIINSLNGRKILILGNHDRKSTHWYLTHGFSFVCDSFVLDGILFTHRPVEKIEKWKFNIFGHIHDKVLQKYTDSRYICVSVERISYTPVLLDSLIKRRERDIYESGRTTQEFGKTN